MKSPTKICSGKMYLGFVILVSMACGCEKESSTTQVVVDRSNQKNNRPEEKPLNILCWNVLYGFNHAKSIDEGCQWVAKQKPHVVALQELNGNTADSLKALAAKWEHNHSLILKEKGFPVALTSDQPIELIQKQVEGFHHGYLHCKTHGIHFVVVHFWPGKEHELETIMERLQPVLESGEEVVVLGDFNSNSRFDADDLATRIKITPRYENVDLLESNGFVDLVHKHDPRSLYTCPSPITIPKWSADMDEINSKRQRIDFIFASKTLAERSLTATVTHSKEVEQVSDHYPVSATVNRKPGKRTD